MRNCHTIVTVAPAPAPTPAPAPVAAAHEELRQVAMATGCHGNECCPATFVAAFYMAGHWLYNYSQLTFKNNFITHTFSNTYDIFNSG